MAKEFGDGRFVVQKTLGAGGMGVVYEVHDVRMDRTIALKTLKNAGATALYLFKNEFRALADLRHKNLIRIHELFCEKDPWFFTMELVDGVDLLTWLRNRRSPAQPTNFERTLDAASFGVTAPVTGTDPTMTLAGARHFDPNVPQGPGVHHGSVAQHDRLRDVFLQLARALSVLHSHKKVHRDVKPSNVLVTTEGRVVLMDFGLVAESTASGGDVVLAGTPLYMAPELMSGRSGPAVDWYAFGVMLYEALTGRPPFLTDNLVQLFEHKRRPQTPPRQIVPEVPEDLDRLCADLLNENPDARPNSDAILSVLGGGVVYTSGDEAREASNALHRTAILVGQERELSELARALQDSRDRGALAVLVCGESGIGKSTLVRRFLSHLPASENALILSGRCYEQELLPYKAFDGIVDALCRHLLTLPADRVERILPHEAPILARVFPVLARLPQLSIASPQSGHDPGELRHIAFVALREMLARCAADHPVILFIDDLQWSDSDSLLLLSELIRPPAGRYLICASVRGDPNELIAEKGTLRLLRDVRSALRVVSMNRLSQVEALALVHELSGLGGSEAQALVDEAEGHPLFLRELALHAHHTSDQKGTLARLDDVLAARVSRLPDAARLVLTLVALSGAPIAQRTLGRAAGLSLSNLIEQVDELRAAYFVRTMGRGDFDTVEPYHDRIRESLTHRLDADAKRKRHFDLGVALEEAGAAEHEPQVLLRHFEAAGETQRAAQHAERAADRAHRAFAFDQAAELLQAALRLGHHDAANTQRLRLALGDALGNAGRGAEAADVFLEVAETADPRRRFECRSRAADHLLCAGYLDKGAEILRSLLSAVGEELPSPKQAFLEYMVGRVKLRMRGLGYRRMEDARVSQADALRADIYRTISLAVTPLEPLAGTLYTLKTLQFALEVGEPIRLADALAGYGMCLSLQGPQYVERGRLLVARAQQVLDGAEPDPMTQAWIHTASGGLTFWGQGLPLDEADRQAHHGDATLRKRAGAAKRLSTTQILRITILYAKGDYRSMIGWGRDLINDAIRRRDYYGEFSFTALNASSWLAEDDPAGLAEQLRNLTPWLPKEETYHVQHYYELRAKGDLALYTNDLKTTLATTREHLSIFPMAMRLTPCMLGTVYWTLTRLLLASARNERDPLLKEAESYAAKLNRLKLGFTVVQSRLALAAIYSQRGRYLPAVMNIEEAERMAHASDMWDTAAAARVRHGQIVGGERGRQLVQEGYATLSKLGARNPERMVALLAPGFKQ